MHKFKRLFSLVTLCLYTSIGSDNQLNFWDSFILPFNSFIRNGWDGAEWAFAVDLTSVRRNAFEAQAEPIKT